MMLLKQKTGLKASDCAFRPVRRGLNIVFLVYTDK